MTLLTQEQVRQQLRRAGLTMRQARIGSAIALCESPGPGRTSDFGAIGDIELADDVWGYSYGGFQIRSLHEQAGTGGIRDEERLGDVAFNIRSAVAIHAVSGWRPWSTYTSGMFKAYLQDLFPPPANSYVVVSGDTLSSIAVDQGESWTWQDLARVNGLHDPFAIYIGQILQLP